MILMQALVGAKQFDGVLGSRQRMPPSPHSPHFALHYTIRASTDIAHARLRLGFIVAKKLSKQARRRNQIRRIWKAEIYLAFKAALAQGVELDLVVRQKATFHRAQFISAVSTPLKAQIQQEARALLTQCLQQPAVHAHTQARAPLHNTQSL
jgi:ribonuclease P protein component